MKINRAVFLVFFFLGCLSDHKILFAQVRLPKLVQDSMVVQRDTKLKIWGWAAKGEKVKVSFNGKKYQATTGDDEKWSIWLAPTKAGGPYTMNITASNSITINQILAGDVWICSGQSNMVHYLDLHKERYAEDIAQANYPQIRQFIVPTVPDLQRRVDDLPNGAWKMANPWNVLRFSVVGYFFAKKLYERYRIPIGIINASVGGTPIESWISEEGLKEFPDVLSTVQKNKDSSYVNSTNRAATLINRERAKLKGKDKGMLESPKWYDTTYVPKNWRRISVPGYWEDQGVQNMNGVVWYQREIDVPASMTGIPARIAMGRIIDADFLYINGVQVGRTTYQYPQRRYPVPAGVLKPGKNILVIRVLNDGGKGGFVPDKPYYLAAGNQTIDLTGYWQYKVGEVYPEYTSNPDRISIQDQPTASFNAMVSPLINFSVKGILWYQGESNTRRPEQYKKLLPALIADWRNQWKQPNVPFLVVQLHNFGDADYTPPVNSEWALMREAQQEALTVPNTAMVLSLDLGEWNDIHPGNKKPIGERLALAAQRIAYADNKVVYSGPQYVSYKTEGNKIIVSFEHTGSGLIAIDGEPLSHFAIAGADKKFVWANTKIENNTVVLWNDDMTNPIYIRYAWADNPAGANLYNKEGLPALPFRTDR